MNTWDDWVKNELKDVLIMGEPFVLNPYLCTDDLIEEVKLLVSVGVWRINTIAGLVDVSSTTLYRWQSEAKHLVDTYQFTPGDDMRIKLFDEIRKSKRDLYLQTLGNVKKAGQDPKLWASQMTLIERLDRDFQRTQKVEVEVNWQSELEGLGIDPKQLLYEVASRIARELENE
jgi:hypothetical protein